MSDSLASLIALAKEPIKAPPRPRKLSAEELADVPSEAECLAELDAIAASLGIVWSGPEVMGSAPAERTRYATPGTRCGTGYVREVKPAQIRLIRRLMAERDMSSLVRLPGSENIDRMSLRGASDLIDRLMACPFLPESARPAPVGEGFYRVDGWLYEVKRGRSSGRCYAMVYRPGTASWEYRPGAYPSIRPEWRITADEAAEVTGRTRSSGAIRAASSAESIEDGVYRVAGVVYKVVHAIHGSGHQYAKRFNPETKKFKIEYGAIRRIRPEHALSYVEAVEFGKLYGVCAVCGTELNREESIEAGIGPVCAGKRYGVKIS